VLAAVGRGRRLDQHIGHRLNPVVVQVDDEIGRAGCDHVEQAARNPLAHRAFRPSGKAAIQILTLAVDEARDILEAHRIDQRQRVQGAGAHAGLAHGGDDIVDDRGTTRLVAVDTGREPDARAGPAAVERQHGDASLDDVAHARNVDQTP